MKKTAAFIMPALIIVTGVSLYAGIINDPVKFVMDLMKKYSPTGYYILHETAAAPSVYNTEDFSVCINSADFTMYIEENEETAIIFSLNTIVHEMCHDYATRMVPVVSKGAVMDFSGYKALYTGGNETILVKITKTFRAAEMASSFPAHLRTFRFETYVSTESSVGGTQVNGAYGFLDEMNAYYHGTKAMMDMMPYFKSTMPQTQKTWEKFILDTGDSMAGCLEQKMFLLRYLMYAEKKYPRIYRGIMENREFRKAYTRIESNINALLERYHSQALEICGIMKGLGLDAKMSGGVLYFGSTSPEIFVDTRVMLLKEFRKDEYVRIIKVLNN